MQRLGILSLFTTVLVLFTQQSALAVTFGNDGAPWLIASDGATKIEAENYDEGGNGGAWFDSTLDNLGGQFRVAGPDIQNTSDCSGGFNVGWIETGEWLQYTIRTPVAGTYELLVRTARAPLGDGSLRLSASPNSGSFIGSGDEDTVLIDELVIPHTNGWQVWRSNSATINLDEGVQTLQFEVTGSSGFSHNFNWFTLRLIEADQGNTPSIHPDIVRVLDIPESEIPFGPGGDGWADSYSVGDQCYCDSSFDHNIADILVDGPNGQITVQQACELIGEGPGRQGRPIYNDIQCGNGPANDAGDEDFCPGRVDIGKPGCGHIGPSWKFQ